MASSTASASAVDRVLNTAELLELILLQLDIGTLLTKCMIVSRHWREAIVVSPALQRALFFRPVLSRGKEPPINAPLPIFNPLLQASFPHLFDERLSMGKHNFIACPSGMPDKGLECRQAFAYKEASWRDMLVTQPPVATYGIWTWNRMLSQYGGSTSSWFRRYKPLESGRELSAEGKPCTSKKHPANSCYLTAGVLYDSVQHCFSVSAHDGPTCTLGIKVFWKRGADFDFRMDPELDGLGDWLRTKGFTGPKECVVNVDNPTEEEKPIAVVSSDVDVVIMDVRMTRCLLPFA